VGIIAEQGLKLLEEINLATEKEEIYAVEYQRTMKLAIFIYSITLSLSVLANPDLIEEYN
jgi:hypothetical protein